MEVALRRGYDKPTKSTPSPNRLTTCFVGHTNPIDPKLSFQLRFDCGEMGRLQPAATGPKWLRNCCCCCCCCRCCSCRCRCCCCFRDAIAVRDHIATTCHVRDAIAVRDEIAALEIHQTWNACTEKAEPSQSSQTPAYPKRRTMSNAVAIRKREQGTHGREQHTPNA
jgi:hypothetical protein